MEMTLSKWMGLAITAVVISALVWNLLVGKMGDIANAIAGMMN